MDAQTLLREISTRFSERLDSEVKIDGRSIEIVEYLQDDNTIRIYSESPADEEVDDPIEVPLVEAEGKDPGIEVAEDPTEVSDDPDEVGDYEELSNDEMQEIAEALNDSTDDGGTS